MTVLKESPDGSAVVSIEEIDFSKYRTKELANLVGDLVSLPKSVSRLAITIVVCISLAMLLIYFAMRLDEQGVVPILLSEAYGLPASILFAIAIWIVMLIHRSLSTLTVIIDLLLEATIQISKDYKQLGRGERKLPPMAKLVGAVYEHVFMHVLRETLSSATGMLGKPIYWVFSLTLGRMLSIVVKKIATWTASQDDKAEMKKTIDELLPEVADNATETISGLEWAKKMINSSGNWLSKRMLWPCYAILGIFFAILAAPIVSALILR